MKFCPACETKYDEEILRFCIKDGTPLVEEKAPEFKEIPSETLEDDDIGEQTIISRNRPSTPLPPPDQPTDSGTERLDQGTVQNETQATSPGSQDRDSKRIVISTQKVPPGQTIRSKDSQTPDKRRTQKKSNAAMVALLSILGTLVVLAGAVGIYWFLGGRNTIDANSNQNVNLDTNLDENLDTNFNADDLLNNFNLNSNINANSNSNFNVNANTETPSPTPTKTPTPPPTPSPSPTTNVNANVANNANAGNGNPATPTKTPTPTPTTPSATPTRTPSTNINKPVNVGQINGRAIKLPTPAYTPAARRVRASGRVTVKVVVDEGGNVVSANATAGHMLLRRSAEQAARRSKFKPVTRNGQAVKSTGTIAYNFVN